MFNFIPLIFLMVTLRHELFIKCERSIDTKPARHQSPRFAQSELLWIRIVSYATKRSLPLDRHSASGPGITFEKMLAKDL